MADVTGLTALSQDCSAAEMVRMLNELFGRFDQLAAVQRLHSNALFGTPSSAY